MRRTLAIALAVLLVASVASAQQTGSVSGKAKDDRGKDLPGVTLQLRSVDTGFVSGMTTSGPNGAFQFLGVNPGHYIVEVVDATGKVIGASSSMTVAAGAAVSGVTVAASSAGALAAAAAAGGAGAFFTTTGGILVLVASGAIVTAGVVTATRDASGSR
jgi:hypothetical protein